MKKFKRTGLENKSLIPKTFSELKTSSISEIFRSKLMEKKDIDLKYYAKVHSIESFGTVDGPGIRFVLFLQGCHLQCKYCHNRDTWNMNGGEYKSLDDIFEKIMKYKNYIYPNGGVTVTGGEPLLQVKFLIELFEKLKKERSNIYDRKSDKVRSTVGQVGEGTNNGRGKERTDNISG